MVAPEDEVAIPERIHVLGEQTAAAGGFRRKPSYLGASVITIAWCRVNAWRAFVKIFWSALFLSVVYVAMRFTESPATANFMAVFWGVLSLLAGYWVLAGFVNRTTIRISSKAVHWRHGPLPFAFGGRVCLAEVAEVDTPQTGTACGLVLVTESGVRHEVLPATDTFGADDASVQFILRRIESGVLPAAPKMNALPTGEALPNEQLPRRDGD